MRILHLSDLHFRGQTRHQEYQRNIRDILNLQRGPLQADLLLLTGDIWHTKTQGISPESIDVLSWFFRECSDAFLGVRVILGNHDGNLTNLSRQDVISPILGALNLSNITLWKKSGTYVDPAFQNVAWGVWSPFDKEGWKEIKPSTGKVNIGLFHGVVQGAVTDSDWRLEHQEAELHHFRGKWDFVLLGDIHKRQILETRPDRDGTEKPWIAYAGSMIQQNHGEGELKGGLIWDIRSAEDWDLQDLDLPNHQPFLTTPWEGTPSATLQRLVGERTVPPGSRVRVSSPTALGFHDPKDLTRMLQRDLGVESVAFKTEVASQVGDAPESPSSALLTHHSLRSDPDLLGKMFGEWEDQVLGDRDPRGADLLKSYLEKVNLQAKVEDGDQGTVRDVFWSPEVLRWDNTFRYGSGNSLGFKDLAGVIGIFGNNASGKALSLRTEIATTTGWKTIGSVAVGDFVFSKDGKPTRVVAKSPIYHNHVCYEVEFSDGTKVVADSDHLWEVQDARSRVTRNGVYQILTTDQLKKRLLWREKSETVFDGYEWSVDVCDPVQYPSNHTFSIHPYVLGCWLGDGTSSSSGFTCADPQILENIRAVGEIVRKHNCKEKDTTYAVKMLAPRLRNLGVLGNKHIPEKYLMASVEDRQKLLAGLLDTDGYSNPTTGTVEFCNTNQVLAQQTLELVLSLGYKATMSVGDATLYGRFISKKYRVQFTPNEYVFNLDRKNQSLRPGKKFTATDRRFVVGITKVKREPVQCLVVDNPDHLFLITRSFVPTHNSSVIGSLLYGLFGNTDRGPVKAANVINIAEKRCQVQVEFRVGQDLYQIERTTFRKESKKSKDESNSVLHLWSLDPVTRTRVKSLNGDTGPETDKVIRKLIGQPDDFLLTSVSSQGDITRFIDRGATQRKAILGRFLDLDLFDKLFGLVKEDLNLKRARLGAWSLDQTTKAVDDLRDQIQGLEEDRRISEERRGVIQEELSGLSQKVLGDTQVLQVLEQNLLRKQETLSQEGENLEKLQREEQNLLEVLGTHPSEESLGERAAQAQKVSQEIGDLNLRIKAEQSSLVSIRKKVKLLGEVPCGDQFPGCKFIKDSWEASTLEPLKETLVKTLGGELQVLQEALKTYGNVAGEVSIVQGHKRNLSKVSEKVMTLMEKTQRTSLEVEDLKSQVEDLRSSASPELLTRKEELEKKAKQLSQEVLRVAESLGARKLKLSQSEKALLENEPLLKEIQVLERVYQALGKNALPAMVLAQALPSLNRELERILHGVVDFRVTLETDTGGSSNVMDVFLEDVLGKRPLEVGSGAEQMISALALRVALYNLSTLPKPDLFVVDEGFGVLDEVNLQRVTGFLQSLKNWFRTVLVISHVPQIKDAVDNALDIGWDSEGGFPTLRG